MDNFTDVSEDIGLFLADKPLSDTTKYVFAKLIEKSNKLTEPRSVSVQKNHHFFSYAQFFTVRENLTESLENEINTILSNDECPFVISFTCGDSIITIRLESPAILISLP